MVNRVNRRSVMRVVRLNRSIRLVPASDRLTEPQTTFFSMAVMDPGEYRVYASLPEPD